MTDQQNDLSGQLVDPPQEQRRGNNSENSQG